MTIICWVFPTLKSIGLLYPRPGCFPLLCAGVPPSLFTTLILPCLLCPRHSMIFINQNTCPTHKVLLCLSLIASFHTSNWSLQVCIKEIKTINFLPGKKNSHNWWAKSISSSLLYWILKIVSSHNLIFSKEGFGDFVFVLRQDSLYNPMWPGSHYVTHSPVWHGSHYVTYSPVWPGSHYVTQAGLKFVILLP